MKKKFLQFLIQKTKDMGLSEKAINELVEAGAVGLTDESSDEEIQAKVDSVVPFARAMQGEYTRKVQEAKQSQHGHDGNHEGGNEGNGGEGGSGSGVPDWFRTYKEEYEKKIAALESENAGFKSARAREERSGQIAAKAKELGIPDFLMRHMSIDDNADFNQVLTDYKQELVNNRLIPADKSGEKGSEQKAMEDAAKAWAESLPNK